ncbi:2-aminoethanethiol dioxygenase [Anoplophora glabripennis]|uniref:2-aminoethanethiol dioxygenase n=1 Tax=Anoplophora glabripennis TaxID=217634 RepID=UPI0008746B12|nr:2-aminoethanethiol dioxygenase [Anoplophora glabripennis]
MTNHINNVLKQAITTFTCKPEVFSLNLHSLISLLDKTTAEDVNFPFEFTKERVWKQPRKAPVTCIDIFENSHVTMGIFILKPGGRLPLHNHPEMYGLIKVIAGKVKITSYSLNTERTLEIDRRSFKGESAPPISFGHKQLLTAELSSSEIVDTTSTTCMLEPNRKNLHEIESIDGPAAFLDILAPPYGTIIPNVGPRLCSYYAVLSQISSNIFRLQEIRSPSWYWTDAFPYSGPELVL